MKVYSGLAVFASYGMDSYVLTTINGGIPKWELTDESYDSLKLIHENFVCITGISAHWDIRLRQSGFFEQNSKAEKIAIVVYTTYFPAKQDLQFKNSYKWSKLSELRDNDEFTPILMYLAAQRS